MLIACIANPIFINTFVVFVRLYWFEKRFKHIVRDARIQRRSRARSKTVSEMKADPNPSRIEMGVNGRTIRVLHHTTKPNGMSARTANGKVNGLAEKEALDQLTRSISNPADEGRQSSSENSSSQDPTSEKRAMDRQPSFRREITFADEVKLPPDSKRRPSEAGRLSESRNAEQHIAFLERQRKLDQGTLRIPGPRDFDRGDTPRELESDEEEGPPGTGIRRRSSSFSEVGRPKLEQRSTEHHIVFLEKQRKLDQGTLRIPGPRDFDRGLIPHELESDEEGNELVGTVTRTSEPEQQGHGSGGVSSGSSEEAELKKTGEEEAPKHQKIVWDEPQKPTVDRSTKASSESASTHTRFNLLRPLKSLRRGHEGSSGPASGFRSARTRTFSFTKSQDRDLQDPTPYLSWQPTIGRNSAFVTHELTEEQREELGGIEYRSLKTLAMILVTYYLGFHFLGFIVYIPWILLSGTWGPIVDADGVNRTWWSVQPRPGLLSILV